MKDKIIHEMGIAESKAWEALSGYKFWMFGYHAARWVNLNALLVSSDKFKSPFLAAVKLARTKIDQETGNNDRKGGDLFGEGE